MPEILVAGQVGDPTLGLPSGKGAKLFWLNPASFGQTTKSIMGATDAKLRFESDDYPILSEAGRTILRRLFVRVAFRGSCILQVTPRIDFNEPLTPETWEFTSTTTVRVVRVLDTKVARVCSYAGVRVDVLSRDGAVEILGLACAHKPLAQAADLVAGSEVST